MKNKLLGDRYELGEMIGTGGMADVYIARDKRLAREVAVKVLRSDLAKDPSFVARFRKEAFAAAGLNNPGIVAVYDSGEEPAPYIVMELVSGHTLRELIHSGEKLPLSRALEIGAGILAALEYSHECGIVHRDIKPANIMITDQGDVKVMDFGIARILDDLNATLTSTWNIVGTAQYLSPEQALGEAVDARSDIYSTGCLLYELLTGKPPFVGDTPVSIAYQHVSAELVAPSKIQPALPAGIDILLAVALAKKPEDRYQSAGLMLDDLFKIRDGQAVTTKISRKKISRWQFISGAVAALLFLSLAIGGLFLSRDGINTTSEAEIPNVVGLIQADAQIMLKDYVVAKTEAVPSDSPQGTVLKVTPEPGSTITAGTGVVLRIASGEVQVPDLIGVDAIQAKTILVQAGFLVNEIEAYDASQSIGVVIRQAPDAGTTQTIGKSVTITINKAP